MAENDNSKVIGIINGPNLDVLGDRNPSIYGGISLDDIIERATQRAESQGWTLKHFQSNVEGQLVDIINQEYRFADVIIINAAAYTHTSIAIHDALSSYRGFLVEVHLSNIYAREPFRHVSYISPIADGIICGLGPQVYERAVDSAIDYFATVEFLERAAAAASDKPPPSSPQESE